MSEKDIWLLQMNRANEALNLTSRILIDAGFPERVDSIRELIYHNEGQIGLEILCDNLDDLESPLSQDVCDFLVDVCRENRVGKSRLQLLRDLVI